MKSAVEPWFEDLRQLAALAATCPPSRTGLVRLADALKVQLGTEQVCFVYAEELDWVTCGDSSGGAQAAPGLITIADAALYRAKSGGGNLVCAQPAAASVA